MVAENKDEEREDWIRASLANLARAYGDSEPEYTLADVILPNPALAEEDVSKAIREARARKNTSR